MIQFRVNTKSGYDRHLKYLAKSCQLDPVETLHATSLHDSQERGAFLNRIWYNLASIAIAIFTALCFGIAEARAGQLADRLASFPNWQGQPSVAIAKGDLIYPNWMAGTWNCTSTLVDLAAPLAPNIITPGFAGNRQSLQKPVQFLVRFVLEKKGSLSSSFLPIVKPKSEAANPPIVADRAFNGLNIAKAYLGDRGIISVKVDPDNPNRQITQLGGDRQLVSIVTGRSSEIPSSDRFIATEISQQIFQGETQIYLNQVETTTAYQRLPFSDIEADQVTAVYLSPQDPNYFQAAGHPVALYRYRLQLQQAR